MFETLHGVKKGIKDIVAPQGMFEDLGLKYLGPVDGHDEQAVEAALRQAKAFAGPVIVHVITPKGRGYQPALDDDADHFHGIGKINPETGLPFRCPDGSGPTSSTRRWWASAPNGPTSWRSPRRCSSRSGSRLRRAPTPTASSTSASPSSTP